MTKKRLKLVIDKTNEQTHYRIYEFLPSRLHLFYKNLEELSFQRWVRFQLELFRNYRVFYLEVENQIVAYSVISRGGGRYRFAQKQDIVIGPYFVVEEFRGNKYSELLVSELIDYSGIEYRYAYDWIRRNNVASLKCSERVGLVPINTADVVGPFRKIVIREDGSGEYTILRK